MSENLPVSQLLSKVDELTTNRKFSSRYRGQINKVFNTELSIATERQHLLTLITNASMDKDNNLDKCHPEALKNVLPAAARTGLSLDPALGHLYVIPYSGIPSVKLGYKGIMHLAYLSSTLSAINVQLVHENDVYEETHTSSGPDFIFKPARGKKNRGKIVGCFCHAIFKVNGAEKSYLEYVFIEEVERFFGKTPAWKFWMGQMFRKFTIRRGSVYWPKDKVLNELSAIMDEFDDKIDYENVSAPAEEEEEYVVISEDQKTELYALIYDFNYARFDEDEAKAKQYTEQWLDRLSEKYTIPSIGALPADKFEEAVAATKQRMAKIDGQPS